MLESDFNKFLGGVSANNIGLALRSNLTEVPIKHIRNAYNI